MMQEAIDCSGHQWNMPVESNMFDSSVGLSSSGSPLTAGLEADEGRLQEGTTLALRQ